MHTECTIQGPKRQLLPFLAGCIQQIYIVAMTVSSKSDFGIP